MAKKGVKRITSEQIGRSVSQKLGVPYSTVLEIYRLSADMTCQELIEGKNVVWMGLAGFYTIPRRCWVPPKKEMQITMAVRVKAAVGLRRALRIINKKDAPGGASEDVSGG